MCFKMPQAPNCLTLFELRQCNSLFLIWTPEIVNILIWSLTAIFPPMVLALPFSVPGERYAIL